MLTFSFSRDNVPEWFKEPCIMGIDEAGRGPVLGSMVYACAIVASSLSDSLRTRNFMDSKVLTKERRTQLYNEIENDQNLAFLYDETSARFISGCMLAKERISLNSIAMESTCRLIQQAVQTGLNLIHVYVDTVGKPEKHKQELENVFPGIKFTVCPKADALYPIVSIASIVAKVSRDEALISVAEGVNDSGYGSGYPGDPETKAWLVNNVDNVFGFDSMVRFSWSTCVSILERDCINVKWESDAEADANQASLTNILGTRKRSSEMQFSYFKARKLQHLAW